MDQYEALRNLPFPVVLAAADENAIKALVAGNNGQPSWRTRPA